MELYALERAMPGSASTTLWNCVAWLAYAPRHVAATRRTRSVNAGSPLMSVRNASVLTKKPMRPCVSACARPADGVPTTTSSAPAWRASSALKPASSAMNSVAPCSDATRRSVVATSPGISNSTRAPRPLDVGGRRQSVGSSSSGGAPASVLRQ
eukprot:144393-Chlamydomonas_euryale.AAC.7